MRIVWAMDFGNQAPKRRCRCTRNQSLKSLWTQGNAVSAPPITGIRRSYTSNFIKNAWRPIITCWRAQSWYKVPPPLIFHFNHSLFAIFCHRSVMNRSVGVYDQIWGCWVAVNFLLGVFMSQWLRFLRSLVLSPVSNCCNYLSLCHKKWDYCSSTDREVSGQWTLFKASWLLSYNYNHGNICAPLPSGSWSYRVTSSAPTADGLSVWQVRRSGIPCRGQLAWPDYWREQFQTIS